MPLENLKTQTSHPYLYSILFIKEKMVPYTPVIIATGSIALSLFCVIVPNVYSPIVFKVTIITLATYGSCLLFCFITPYLPETLQTASKHMQSFARELIAVLFFAAIYFVDLSKDNLQNKAKESDPLIIFVPGYLHNSSGAVKIKFKIENETGIAVRCINSNSIFESIEDYTDRLGQEIKKIQIHEGQRKIKLIGHSMGGLVVLNYFFKNLSSVDSVVTISSPCQGTNMAYLANGKCAKEMRPHSEFIDQLNQKSKNNPNCRILQIGLKHDLIVPLQSAFLEDIPKQNTKIIEEIGHADILMSDEMIDVLINEIKRTPSKVY